MRVRPVWPGEPALGREIVLTKSERQCLQRAMEIADRMRQLIDDHGNDRSDVDDTPAYIVVGCSDILAEPTYRFD